MVPIAINVAIDNETSPLIVTSSVVTGHLQTSADFSRTT